MRHYRAVRDPPIFTLVSSLLSSVNSLTYGYVNSNHQQGKTLLRDERRDKSFFLIFCLPRSPSETIGGNSKKRDRVGKNKRKESKWILSHFFHSPSYTIYSFTANEEGKGGKGNRRNEGNVRRACTCKESNKIAQKVGFATYLIISSTVMKQMDHRYFQSFVSSGRPRGGSRRSRV